LKYTQSAEADNFMITLGEMHTKKRCVIENKVKLAPIQNLSSKTVAWIVSYEENQMIKSILL